MPSGVILTIAGWHITMNDTLVVRSLEGAGGITRNLQRVDQGRRRRRDAFGERWPFDHFEDQRQLIVHVFDAVRAAICG